VVECLINKHQALSSSQRMWQRLGRSLLFHEQSFKNWSKEKGSWIAQQSQKYKLSQTLNLLSISPNPRYHTNPIVEGGNHTRGTERASRQHRWDRKASSHMATHRKPKVGLFPRKLASHTPNLLHYSRSLFLNLTKFRFIENLQSGNFFSPKFVTCR
jgi:hypothetical protein